MAATSRVPALIDWLVNAFTNAATLGQATPPVAVFDGPVVTAAPAQLALYVGVDDVFSDAAPISATSEQVRQGLAQHRQETSAVHCCAVAWAGTDDARTVRGQAFAILAAAEDLIRTNSDSFGGNAGAALPGVSGITLQQSSAEGTTAQVSFTVTFVSFIGS
jgi:hypothetical protein